MGAALGWGTLAASSLVLGALLGIVRKWPARLVGLGLGALTYFVCDAAVDRLTARMEARPRISSGSGDAGPALALGAALDGIPEQLVLGIGLATGGTVGVGLLVAIFVWNLPEAIVTVLGFAVGAGLSRLST